MLAASAGLAEGEWHRWLIRVSGVRRRAARYRLLAREVHLSHGQDQDALVRVVGGLYFVVIASDGGEGLVANGPYLLRPARSFIVVGPCSWTLDLASRRVA